MSRYTRNTVVAAARVIGDLGHAEIDDLLLEWGIEGLAAGRDLGGRMSRGTAIGKFIVDNDGVNTAEGECVRSAIVRRARQRCDLLGEYTNGPERDRCQAFTVALANERVEDGTIAVAVESSAQPDVVRPEPQARRHADEGSRLMAAKIISNRVFVVHGRDDAAKDKVSLFLGRLGLDAVILHEQPNRGRTLLAKFQDEAASVSFAVVLMTKDDKGCLRNENNPKARARQNVVFELGFFIGSLGAQHVCALVEPGLEKPSDFDAIVYVEYGPNSGWERLLARELKEAGLPIKMDGLL
jgi:predicted nucleotide-binding protein